ncbi:hypothetical protein BDP27DRAFT_1370453 [Rhodocollybia butyracea]|uniref:DUF4246 domain-containing protein n=1 Tax=Rhodocollybia butyracea TaxID=206335 RepID=A0A9P5PBQ8_9AGAR|nr:hypothetical protein BDP27DRAFT_1370453 [Rhodocollybia butyracea]
MSQNEVPRSLNPSDQDLSQFCVAVREKLDWQSKIFDDKIALKWVIEAEFAAPDTQVLEGRALEAVRDLRCSVSTVKMLDCDVLLPDASGAGLDNSPEHFDINTVNYELSKSLKYARGSNYALREPNLKVKGLGILVSDNLVPQALHQELMRQLDSLAAQEPRDFHSGSFGKVQDLIHPSLFPYIAGTTPVSSSDVKLPSVGTDNKFDTWLYAHISSTYPENMVSSYAWIPSIFSISPDRKYCHNDSYINGLGTREQYPGLFTVIEKLFLLALPHFERTLKESNTYWPEDSPSGLSSDGARVENLLGENQQDKNGIQRETSGSKVQLEQDIRQEDCIKETFYDLGDEFSVSEMYKGKDMKVIVKAANYILKPGQDYEGSWHMEGMPHERIVASVIYYYDTDGPIQDEGLSFRFFFSGDFEFDYPSDWEVEMRDGKPTPVLTNAIPAFTELGAVLTTNTCPGSNGTGRMHSFPNWIQFCFFLVDDTVQDRSENHFPGIEVEGLENMNVLTTSEVPMQMRRCNEPTMFALISAISADLTGRALPPELLNIIWGYASEGTLSREEAEMHRLRLMKDRRVSHRTAKDYYSLCEH